MVEHKNESKIGKKDRIAYRNVSSALKVQRGAMNEKSGVKFERCGKLAGISG